MIHDPYEFEVGERVREIHRDVKELRKVHPTHLVPRFSKIYDSLRTEQGWRYMADNWSNGSIATSLVAPATADVDFNQQFIARTSQWPGAVQFYLVIRLFSIAPETSQAGNIVCVYEDDNSGITVPLGVFVANATVVILIDTD